LQPTWSGIEEGFNRQPGGFKKMGNEYWRNEAFNRFMDYRNFPDVQFRGTTRGWYPRGMSSPNLKPTDMYFDKIWKDKWEPHAKAYDEKVKEIAERKKSPKKIIPKRTASVHSPHGGGPGTGGGYQPTSRAQNVARTSSRVGPGGKVKAYGLAHGGLIDIPLSGRSRYI